MKKDRAPEWIIWLVHIICLILVFGTGYTVYRYSENEYFRDALRGNDYPESRAFEAQVSQDLQNVVSYIRLARKMETNGEVDPDKIVLTGINENGAHVAYTMKNALDYGRTIGIVFDANNRLVAGQSAIIYDDESMRKKGTVNEETALLSLLYELDHYYELRRLLSMDTNRSGNFRYRLVLQEEPGDVTISTNVEPSLTRQEVLGYGRYFALESATGTLSSNFSARQIDAMTTFLDDGSVFADDTYELLLGIDTEFPEADGYRRQSLAFHHFARLLRLLLLIGALLCGSLLLSFLALAFVGRKEMRGIDLWFTEVVILGIVLAGLVVYWGLAQIRYGLFARNSLDILTGTVLCLLMYFPILFCLLSLFRRGRNHCFRNSFLCVRAVQGILEGFRNRNDRVKSGAEVIRMPGFLLAVCGLAFLAGLQFQRGHGLLTAGFLVLVLLLCAWHLNYIATHGRQVKAIFERIAALGGGDVGQKLDISTLHGDVRRMAETVNALDHSLERAVNERTSSERMKTELIANVSHDLRTPLTSIINYVDLMKRENIPNPRVQEYLQVLDSKAMRMKDMAEALLEASRASSGNLKIEWERIDMVQMLRQVYGEFQERMEEKQLYPVLRLVDPPAAIRADGKILWRVLDNLYTNVCKYGKPGTQVLIELQETAHNLVYTMKNVSEVPLRYSSEELQERFIRGEDSRTTEGSGLGLSIARSMTEQLNGKFELYSDEEMFRVRLIFPLAEENTESIQKI